MHGGRNPRSTLPPSTLPRLLADLQGSGRGLSAVPDVQAEPEALVIGMAHDMDAFAYATILVHMTNMVHALMPQTTEICGKILQHIQARRAPLTPSTQSESMARCTPART